MALNLPSIRADFPILSRVLPSGHQLVYLDNAATTQKPKAVIQAMTDYYEKNNSNVHRAVHTLAEEATAAYEKARQDIADWFHVEREQVIFTSGTTEAINLVVHGWGRANLKKGDVVLITEMEHHADIVPWQLIAKERGIEIRFVSVDPDTYRLNMDEFEASIDEVSFVGCIHTSNVIGTRNPVEDIIEMAHSRGNHGKGARVLIDCAQASPHEKLNLTELDADFVAISGHKMCGPTGIGSLIVKPEMLDEMQPFMAGGDMIEEVFLDHSTFQTGPYRFEAGTPKIAEAIGWGAAINYLAQFDMREVHQHIHDLAVYTAAAILKIPGFKVYGDHTDPNCSGVVSFLHETIHAEDLAHFLDLGGFAVRTGHHCAQPLMRKLGITATNRASFYLYNTREEADAFIAHLERVDELANDVSSRVEKMIKEEPTRTAPKVVREGEESGFGSGNWPASLQEIIDEFSEIDDPMERYEVLYDWASECELLPPDEWNEDNKVHGCQSEAHVACSMDEETGFRMLGGADAQIVQGLMAITQRAINGLTAEEVADFPATFARELGFSETLTPNRANGFLNMFTKVRKEARRMME